MGKDKRPSKRKAPEPIPEAREPVRQTEEIVPRVAVHTRPLLFRLIQGVRTAIGIMLDAADAAAESIRQNLEGRAH